MSQLRVAFPDLVSSSYFPALAAARLPASLVGDVSVELTQVYPVSAAAKALRDGDVQLLAGPAHGALSAFPGWDGCTVLMALSQHTYWVLVARADLVADRGGVAPLRDLRIAAAPGPAHALRQLLVDAGVDLAASNIEIGPLRSDETSDESFGLRAAAALSDGTIDAFWANTMAAEIAVAKGAGRILLDPRRCDGPKQAADYTFPALMTTPAVLDKHFDDVRAVVRAVVRAQSALREAPRQAQEVANGLFPPLEASLITRLVERDVPYYDPTVSERTVAGLNHFTQAIGLTSTPAAYQDIVCLDMRDLWVG